MGRVQFLAVAALSTACGFREIDEPPCFAYVVASDSHSCARTTEGALYCWGNNQYGQLGTGDTEPRDRPTRIGADLFGNEVAGIYVPSGSGGSSTRTAFTCARLTDGSLWCWGANEYGQLGTGDSASRSLPHNVAPDRLNNDVHAASLGSGFTCVRQNDNSIFCWGANESGQLGTGDYERRLLPEQVDPEGLGTDVRYLATGASHACARKTDGTIWCWGSNQFGQLGTGDMQPRLTPFEIGREQFESTADVIAAGGLHTCATRTDAELFCWGANQYGQLGAGHTGSQTVPNPVDLEGLAGGVPLVSVGGQHTCAAKADGSLWCWGNNLAGQLGNGRTDNSSEPVQVDPAVMDGAISVIYAGGMHTCARNVDGSVWCWGDNQFGQLGIGHGAQSAIPEQVSDRCL
jgi:alpha-tubulin suppressor-like RCC1 family protein